VIVEISKEKNLTGFLDVFDHRFRVPDCGVAYPGRL